MSSLAHPFVLLLSVRRARLVTAVVFAAGAALAAADGAEASIASFNGGFEASSESTAWPRGWTIPDSGASRWERSGDEAGSYLSLRASAPGQIVLSYQSLALPPAWRAIEVSVRARCAGLVPGSAPWHDARLGIAFTSAEQAPLGFHRALAFRENTDGWVTRRIRFPVPPGAARLELMPALHNVVQGTFDLDDIAVAQADPTVLSPAAQAEHLDANLAGPTTAFRERWPAELRIAGNHLADRDGKETWLRGVNVVSLEWLVTGEHVLRAVDAAVADWRSNVVRLPVSEKFWFGQDRDKPDGGLAYRIRVDEAIAAAAGRGAYVVLALYGFGAPSERHAEFWKNAALRYQNHPAVLFDLFNAPHGVSWEIWRDGGFVDGSGGPSAAGAASAPGYRSVGMQRLLEVVRATGARNVVVAAGLDWAYDLSGVANGFALADRIGNGVMYGAHVQSWRRDWERNIAAAARLHPILLGEVGCDVKPPPSVPRERHESPYTWAPDMIGYIQRHRLNWTAFSFHPNTHPVLVSDWTFTPTPFWGDFVKRALAGASFELRNPR